MTLRRRRRRLQGIGSGPGLPTNLLSSPLDFSSGDWSRNGYQVPVFFPFGLGIPAWTFEETANASAHSISQAVMGVTGSILTGAVWLGHTGKTKFAFTLVLGSEYCEVEANISAETIIATFKSPGATVLGLDLALYKPPGAGIMHGIRLAVSFTGGAGLGALFQIQGLDETTDAENYLGDPLLIHRMAYPVLCTGNRSLSDIYQ